MHISEVMTRSPESIGPEATVKEAAERMRDLGVGALLVCDRDQLVGVLTDRDIATRSVSAGRDPLADLVRDAMTPEIVFCYGDQEVSDAANLMKEKQIRRLPILDRANRLIGIVSLGDLAVATNDKQLAGEALERISAPAAPLR